MNWVTRIKYWNLFEFFQIKNFILFPNLFTQTLDDEIRLLKIDWNTLKTISAISNIDAMFK